MSAATQNQALCAIIFMYRHVLNQSIEGLTYSFAKRPRRLPTVLSADEVAAILNLMKGKYRLIAAMLYGCGFRIREALLLRIKDVDFHNHSVLVFRRKGAKDRYTMLPESLIKPLQTQIANAKALHENDLNEGFGMTSVPPALKRKYGQVLKDSSWKYLFPSTTRCVHPYDGYICRHHLHESAFAKQLRKAVKLSNTNRRVTAHTFRHSFATQLLKTGSDIQTVQELLGHADIRTTEIYTHVFGQARAGTTSPIDILPH